MNLGDKTALVTGGGSGIGLAIATQLSRAGAHVVISGRDRLRLEQARTRLDNVTIFPADLSSATERDRLVSYLLAAARPLDILVNNAGTMQYFQLTGSDAQARLDAELSLDLNAPIHLATALLPHLLTRPEAAVVNVTTGLIYAPFGATPGYSVAKAGLHEFTKALRWQTRNSRLHVVELQPPAVDTDLTARFDGSKIGPDKVASALLNGLVGGWNEIRPGQTKALYAMSRIAPRLIYNALNKQADTAPLDA